MPGPMMKPALMLICLVTLPAIAEESAEITAFQAAYANYQQAQEGTNKQARVKYAALALEAGILELGENDPNIPILQYNLGYELLQAGDQEAAAAILEKALEGYEKKYGKDSTELVPLLIDYGNATARLYDDWPQKRRFNRAKKIVEKAYGKNSLEYAKVLIDMGTDITNRSKTGGGRGYFKEAKNILAEIAPDSALYGLATFQLGKLYLSLKQASKTVPELEEALQIFNSGESGDNQLELTTRAFLVDALESLGKRDEATKHCLAIGQMTPATGSQDYQPLLRRTPNYPKDMAQKGREGQVLVEFAVDNEGFVRDGRVIESVGGKLFEKESLRVIDTWRFAPRFINGKPVRTEGVQTIITFKLEN